MDDTMVLLVKMDQELTFERGYITACTVLLWRKTKISIMKIGLSTTFKAAAKHPSPRYERSLNCHVFCWFKVIFYNPCSIFSFFVDVTWPCVGLINYEEINLSGQYLHSVLPFSCFWSGTGQCWNWDIVMLTSFNCKVQWNWSFSWRVEHRTITQLLSHKTRDKWGFTSMACDWSIIIKSKL